MILFYFLCLLTFSVNIAAKAPSPFNDAYQVGEQLHYTVDWTVFRAGYAYMYIPRKIKYQGRECLVLQSGARSSGFLGTLFRVNNKIISYWDFKAKRVLYSERNLQEGNYFRKSKTYYDTANNSASYQKKVFSGNTDKIGKQKKDAKWEKGKNVIQNLPPQIHDMLSALYYNRADPRDGKVGDIFYIDILDNGKQVKLKLKILKEEKITIKINGTEQNINSFVVRPYLTTKGTFRFKGEILVWISKDRHRFPLWIKAEAPVLGHVSIKLHRTVKTTKL